MRSNINGSQHTQVLTQTSKLPLSMDLSLTAFTEKQLKRLKHASMQTATYIVPPYPFGGSQGRQSEHK